MTSFLNWIHRHPGIVWPMLVAYAVAVTLPHIIVQDWLGGVIKPIGFTSFYQIMAVFTVISGSLFTWGTFRAVAGHPARRDLLLAWPVTLALAIFAWRFFTVNNSELVHFGQYLIPGVILLGLTRSVADSLCWILIMAGCDEGYQFWGLHWDWGIPWDFNDIYLDLLGGAFGVLFGFAFLPAARQTAVRWLRPGVLMLCAILFTGFVLWTFGYMLIYEDRNNPNYLFALSRLIPKGFWFFDATWGPRTIHSLTPLEGITLLLATVAGYARLDARWEVSAR